MTIFIQLVLFDCVVFKTSFGMFITLTKCSVKLSLYIYNLSFSTSVRNMLAHGNKSRIRPLCKVADMTLCYQTHYIISICNLLHNTFIRALAVARGQYIRPAESQLHYTCSFHIKYKQLIKFQ